MLNRLQRVGDMRQHAALDRRIEAKSKLIEQMQQSIAEPTLSVAGLMPITASPQP